MKRKILVAALELYKFQLIREFTYIGTDVDHMGEIEEDQNTELVRIAEEFIMVEKELGKHKNEMGVIQSGDLPFYWE